MNKRTESDALGKIDVPADKLWGAQTQRSLQNFPIGDERVPLAVIYNYALLKMCAATVNEELGLLEPEIASAISEAAREVMTGKWDDHFPLVVWQTGSGTQTNMNVNEVLANRASQLLGGDAGKKHPVHPNNHVNLGQSSNDTFPTAMHLAAVEQVNTHLLPALRQLRDGLDEKSRSFEHIVKIGRTHLQDATPLTLGQEFSGYVSQLTAAANRIETACDELLELAIGATAVGSGINTHKDFGEKVSALLAEHTGFAFRRASNPFAAIAAHDAFVVASGALKGLATALTKIANDIRLLGSGPRCGIGELELPANEPGSSIMPGKINPTQCEALIMVCAQVCGNDTTIAIANSGGQLELNANKPVIIHNFLRSLRLLGDGCAVFAKNCVAGLAADEKRITDHLENSLMLVTALVPEIGYDKAAEIALQAHRKGIKLREAAIASGHLDAERYDALVQPRQLT